MKFSELQQKMQIAKDKQTKGKQSFNFRNAEQIFNQFKALKTEWVLNATDEIINVGEKIFVKATVSAKNKNGDETHTAVGYSELSPVPVFQTGNKQMQEPQWTGAVSSYARKYALQGLFAIGEADVDELAEQFEQRENYKQQAKENMNYRTKFIELCRQRGFDPVEVANFYNLDTYSTPDQIKQVYEQLKVDSQGRTQKPDVTPPQAPYQTKSDSVSYYPKAPQMPQHAQQTGDVF